MGEGSVLGRAMALLSSGGAGGTSTNAAYVTMASHTVKANTLKAAPDMLRFMFAGTFTTSNAGNGIQVTFGGQTIVALTGQGVGTTSIEVVLIKAGANSQYAVAWATNTNGAMTISSTNALTQTDTADITVNMQAKVGAGTFTFYIGFVEAMTQ
jgi:hypothetical protein